MPQVQPEPVATRDIFAEIHDKGDCPAMAQAIRELHELWRQDDFPTQALARVILKDPGLSTKVLRVVNSAFFQARGDPITTISRAVVLLGIDTVVDLASGILLVERFDGRDPALATSLLESLRAALIAQALAEKVNLPNPEEAYLLGLFSNLGRLWLAAHYRDELARAIELHASDAHSIEDTIERHFGFSQDLLAAQILEEWGLPEKYSSFFRRSTEPGIRSPIEEKLVLVAELATHPDVDEIVHQAEDLLRVPADIARSAVARALESLEEQAEILGIETPKKRAPRRLASRPAPARAAARTAVRAAPDEDGASEHRRPDPVYGMQAAAGVARAIVDREDLGALLGDVLEGTARAGGFDAVILYLTDRQREALVPRLAHGPGIAPHLEALAVPVSPEGGLAAVTLLDQTPRVVEAASPALLVPTGHLAPPIVARSLAVHPLCLRERAIGVLVAIRSGGPPVNHTVLPVMQLFSQLAALAVDDRASTG